MEATKRWQNYIGENPKSKLVMLTDTPFPRFEVSLAPTTAPDGMEMRRPPLEIDAEEFIAVKGFKAKGKRVTTFDVLDVKELEPTRFPEPERRRAKTARATMRKTRTSTPMRARASSR